MSTTDKVNVPCYIGKGLAPFQYEAHAASGTEVEKNLPPLFCLRQMRELAWVVDYGKDLIYAPDNQLGGYQKINVLFDGAHHILPVDKFEDGTAL